MPLTHEDIRAMIIDRAPDDNDFSQALDFTEAEIIMAMRLMCGAYNDILPKVHRVRHNCIPSVDESELFAKGVIARLFRAKRFQLQRSDVDFSAGDVVVSPSTKLIKYLEVEGSRLEEEFQVAAKQKKVAMNISQGYGFIG